MNLYTTKDENSKFHKSRLTVDLRHYCNNVLNCRMPKTDKDDCYIFALFNMLYGEPTIVPLKNGKNGMFWKVKCSYKVGK